MKMQIFLLTALFAVCLSSSTSWGLTKTSNSNVKPPAPPIISLSQSDLEEVIDGPKAVAAAPSEEAEIKHNSQPSNQTSVESIWVGPGVAIYNGSYNQVLEKGNVGLATNFSWVTPLNPSYPIYVGADAALNFWNTTANGTRNISGTGVQLLATAIYKFTLPPIPKIHPYLGLSLGPHIYIGQTISGTSTTSAFVELLFRPGIQWELSSSLAANFEPKFGVLNSDFMIIPQLTLALAI